MKNVKIDAIALDAFGTLIHYGTVRCNPYHRLLEGSNEDARLPCLIRNVPADVFAAELGLTHKMTEFRRELDVELAGLRLFEEVEAVLIKLRKAGLRLAVCSNLAFEYGQAVRRMLPDFDAYILSFELGVAKPDLAIYAATCQALGCEPGSVLFVGDSKRSDFLGPQSYGMQARWLDRQREESLFDVLDGII